MVMRFSDLFRSQDQEAEADSEAGARESADPSVDVENDGVTVERESSSRDDEGRESYERTSVDTGETDLGSSLDAESDVDQDTDLRASSDEGAGEAASAEADSDTDADQSLEADADVRNEGATIENESYSRDEDGEASYERTSAESGETDADLGVDVDSMSDSFTSLSSSWDDSGMLD